MPKRVFFSDLSSSWDEQHAGQEEQERLRLFSGHFRLRPGDRVLDAGCGSGRLIPVVCDQIGLDGSLVELDFACGMIEINRSKPHPGNVTFVMADAHSLPLPDNDFDKVIALALLPHLDDKAIALKEFHRVLKPGGLLVIAHQMGREALDRLHGRSSEPIQRDLFPENAVLESLMAAAGFSAIEILDEPDHYVAWGQA
ncbi:MAG: methyltransferase domain-containing protein [Candidatus Aminicenantes bacterium]|nr:methyltransferase domain-containing protein [Candidatus Aminicenantes bacterium]